MSVTRNQLLEELEAIEPNYKKAKDFGPEAIPLLEQLSHNADSLVARKAIFLAGLIGGDRATDLLLGALHDPDPVIRVHASAAASHLSKVQAEMILLEALEDVNFRVRNVALKSIRTLSKKVELSEEIKKKVTFLSESDPEQFIKKFSKELLKSPHAN